MTQILTKIKSLYNNPRYTNFFDVGLFIVLILTFHYLYIAWSNAHFFPIEKTIQKLFNEASLLLFNQSCYVLEHWFGIDITTNGQSIFAINNEGSFSHVTVAPECTSLKQWIHWLFLMLIFPGPWKHKTWYIPLGLIVIEFINVVRIVGLILIQIPYPDSFHFAHDYIFKVFFYFIIFIMWVIWVEKFVHHKTKKTNNNIL